MSVRFVVGIECDTDEERASLARHIVSALDIESVVTAAVQAAADQIAQAAKDSGICRQKIFTLRETAKLLGISKSTLQNRRLRGEIEGIKVTGNRGFSYTREAIEEYLGRPLDE